VRLQLIEPSKRGRRPSGRVTLTGKEPPTSRSLESGSPDRGVVPGKFGLSATKDESPTG
jgi:hypothetical protein